MKKLKLIISLIVVCTGLAYTYKSMCATTAEKGPGFELRNQSQLNIMFRLFVKDKQVTDQSLIAGDVFQWEINLNDPLTVEVYEPQSKNILNKVKIDTKGKTKYIAWNPKRYNKPAKYFYPQRAKGLLSPDISISRFNLDNNVEQDDIKRVR